MNSDNARFTAAGCARRGIARVAIVTCQSPLPRARMGFEAEGLEVARKAIDSGAAAERLDELVAFTQEEAA